MRIDRRKALGLLGLGAVSLPAGAEAQQPAPRIRFDHGVASGDPLANRVILWTRVSGRENAFVTVAWEVATDPQFRNLVAAGRETASAARDHTVKVDVGDLSAATTYYYRFSDPARIDAPAFYSPVGRTRTLPQGRTKDAVLAVASCALYPAGYMNAYGAIAALPRLDAVIHIGDYIYEVGGPGSYGMDSPVAAERPHDPPHPCVSLADYRRRHAQYKTDAQLQAAHARAPWICAWDDHEFADDAWTGGAKGHDPKSAGEWNTRKAAAIKAYYEWMPIREPADGGVAINRSFDFGDLASVHMLETRLTGRDHQLTYEADLKGDTPAQVAAFRTKLADPARKMMAPVQETWLRDGLAQSVAAGRRWQVIGAEVLMARIATPRFREFAGDAAYQAGMAKVTGYYVGVMKGAERLGALDLPWNLDGWDGYPADRQRIYEIFKETKANALVVAGDSHMFWADELYETPESTVPLAVEFGTTGISAPGIGDSVTDLPLGEMFAKANREVVFNDPQAKGFVLLTLSRNRARADYMKVSTMLAKDFTTATVRSFEVRPGKPGLKDVTPGRKA